MRLARDIKIVVISYKNFFMEDFYYNTPPTFLFLEYQNLRVSKPLKLYEVCSWHQITCDFDKSLYVGYCVCSNFLSDNINESRIITFLSLTLLSNKRDATKWYNKLILFCSFK